MKKTRLCFEVTNRTTGPKLATFDDNEDVKCNYIGRNILAFEDNAEVSNSCYYLGYKVEKLRDTGKK